MGRSLRWIILSFFLLALFPTCKHSSEKNVDEVLAKIESLEVTKDHFLSSFKKYYYKTGQAIAPSFEIKKSILEAEFNTYVLATYAKDKGIDRSSDAQKMLDMITRRVINEEYRDQVIIGDNIVDEQELKDIFVRLNTTLRASHLFAPTKEEADALYKRVEAGESFDALAKEVFNNAKLANSGGDLGEFGVDEMDIAFEKAAYRLKPGEISKPVRTAQGYSIIKVTDRFQKPIITEAQFANKKSQIRYLAKAQQEELKSREHLQSFIGGINFNESKIDQIWKKISENYTQFLTNRTELLSGLMDAHSALLNTQDFEFSYADFLTELQLTSPAHLNNVQQIDDLKHLLKGLAYRSYLYENAWQTDIPRQEKVQASIDQSYYTYLAERAEEAIRESITVSEAEIRETYRTEREKFVKPVEVNFSRIVLKEKETAEQVHKELLAGAAFDALVDKYTVKSDEKMRSGELGYDYITNFGLFTDKLAGLKVGEFSEPLLYQTGEYHIYMCLGRIDEKLLSLNEARELVENYVREKRFNEKRTNIIETVKEDHEAIVNLEKLKQLRIEI